MFHLDQSTADEAPPQTYLRGIADYPVPYSNAQKLPQVMFKLESYTYLMLVRSE